MPKKYEPGELNPDQIYNKLVRYCEYQERCRIEVRRKCNWLGIDSEKEILIFISKLENDAYLSEDRFAQTFIRGKFQFKKWGQARIERELKLRAIPESIYRQYFIEIDEAHYKEQFKTLADKKWGQIKGKNDFDKKAKLFRYLYTKGYENDLIKEFLNSIPTHH